METYAKTTRKILITKHSIVGHAHDAETLPVYFDRCCPIYVCDVDSKPRKHYWQHGMLVADPVERKSYSQVHLVQVLLFIKRESGFNMPVRFKNSSQQSQVRRATEKLVNGTADIGKFRKYLQPGKGREWDEDSPDTPEGRLVRWNPEDWFAPSRDEKGHEERLTIGFPPAVIEELALYAVNIPDLRNSVKQAVRVSVLEFIRTLRQIQPNKKSHMARIDAATKLNRAAEVLVGYEETFTAGRKNVNDLLLIGARNEARKLAHDLVIVAKSIQSKEVRRRYRKLIEYEFRHLLADGKRVRTNVRRNRILNRARRRQMEENGDGEWENGNGDR